MKKHNCQGWLLVVLLSQPMLAWAEQWVDVECLAFRYLDAREGLSENIPLSAPLIPSRAVNLLPAGQHYTALYYQRPQSEFRFNDSHRHLVQSKQATVIFHQRWRQPLTPKATLKTLLTQTATQSPLYRAQYAPIHEVIFPEKPWHALKYTPNPSAHLADNLSLSQLQLQINSNRYHDVQLTFFEGQYGDPVRLTDTQKLSDNQVFYFDHPLLGVVIQVSTVR